MNRYEFENLISDYLDDSIPFKMRKEFEDYLKKDPGAESLVNNIGIRDKISPSVISYMGVKNFLKRYRILRILNRLLFKKNILNILNEEDIDSQNNIRRYIDLVEERNSRK